MVAVVSDSPKVEAEAEISHSLFRQDINYREKALAIYIKRKETLKKKAIIFISPIFFKCKQMNKYFNIFTRWLTIF